MSARLTRRYEPCSGVEVTSARTDAPIASTIVARRYAGAGSLHGSAVLEADREARRFLRHDLAAMRLVDLEVHRVGPSSLIARAVRRHDER